MEVFSRSVVLVFLLVLTTLVKGQNVVLDCNGKRTICVGPLHYLPCVDKGNGRMESVDGLAQICPVGTECSTMGPESCVPIENNPTAPASETSVTLITQADASQKQTRAIQTTNTIQPNEKKSETIPILDPLINPVVIPNTVTEQEVINAPVNVLADTPGQVNVDLTAEPTQGTPMEQTIDYTPYARVPTPIPARESMTLPIDLTAPETGQDILPEVPAQEAINIPAEQPLDPPVLMPADVPVDQVPFAEVPAQLAAGAAIEVPLGMAVETPPEILAEQVAIAEAPSPEPVNVPGEQLVSELIEMPVAEQIAISKNPAQEIVETPAAEVTAEKPMDIAVLTPTETPVEEMVPAEAQPQVLIEAGAETPIEASPVEKIVQETVDIPAEQPLDALAPITAGLSVNQDPLTEVPAQVVAEVPVESPLDMPVKAPLEIPVEQVDISVTALQEPVKGLGEQLLNDQSQVPVAEQIPMSKDPAQDIVETPVAEVNAAQSMDIAVQVPMETTLGETFPAEAQSPVLIEAAGGTPIEASLSKLIVQETDSILAEQPPDVPALIPSDVTIGEVPIAEVPAQVVAEAPVESSVDMPAQISLEKAAPAEALTKEPVIIPDEQLLTDPIQLPILEKIIPIEEPVHVIAVSPAEEVPAQQLLSLPDQLPIEIPVKEIILIDAPAQVVVETEAKQTMEVAPEPENQDSIVVPVDAAIQSVKDAPVEQTADIPAQATSMASDSTGTPVSLTAAESSTSLLQSESIVEVPVESLSPVGVPLEIADQIILEAEVEKPADAINLVSVSNTPEQPVLQVLDAPEQIVAETPKDITIEPLTQVSIQQEISVTDTKVLSENITEKQIVSSNIEQLPLADLSALTSEMSKVIEPQISVDNTADTPSEQLQAAEFIQEVIAEAPLEPEPTLPTFSSAAEVVNPTGKVYMSEPGVTETQLVLPTAALITMQSAASGASPVDVRVVDPAVDPLATVDVGGEPYVESPSADAVGSNLEATPPAGVEVMDAPTTGTSAVATLPPVEIGTIPDAAFVTPTVATNELSMQATGSQPEASVAVETVPKGEVINIIDPSKFVMAGPASVAEQAASLGSVGEQSSSGISGTASNALTTVGSATSSTGISESIPSAMDPAASASLIGASDIIAGESGVPTASGAVPGTVYEVGSGAAPGTASGSPSGVDPGTVSGAALGGAESSVVTSVPMEGIAIGAKEILSGISFAGGPVMSTGLSAASPPLSGSPSSAVSSSPAVSLSTSTSPSSALSLSSAASLSPAEVIDTSVIQVPSVVGSAPTITNEIPSDATSGAGATSAIISGGAPEAGSSATSSGAEISGVSGTVTAGTGIAIDAVSIVDQSTSSASGSSSATDPVIGGTVGPEISGANTVEAGGISGSISPTGEAVTQSGSTIGSSGVGASEPSGALGIEGALSNIILGGITTMGAEPTSAIGMSSVASAVDIVSTAETGTPSAAEASGISGLASTVEPIDTGAVLSDAGAVGPAMGSEAPASSSAGASGIVGVSGAGAGTTEIGGENVVAASSSSTEPSTSTTSSASTISSASVIDLTVPVGTDTASPSGVDVASTVIETTLAEPLSSTGITGSEGATVNEVVSGSAASQSSGFAISGISTVDQISGSGSTPNELSGSASSGAGGAEPSGAELQLIPSGTPEPSTTQTEVAQLGQLPADSSVVPGQSSIPEAAGTEIGGSTSSGVIAADPSVSSIQLIPSGTPGPETIGANEILSSSSTGISVTAEETTVSIKSPTQGGFQLPSSSFIIAGAKPAPVEFSTSQTEKVTGEVQLAQPALEIATATGVSEPTSISGSPSETFSPTLDVAPQNLANGGVEVSGTSPKDPASGMLIDGITFGGLDASGSPITSVPEAPVSEPETTSSTGVSVNGLDATGTTTSISTSTPEASGISVGAPSIASPGDPTSPVIDGITFGGVSPSNILPVAVSTPEAGSASSTPSFETPPADPVGSSTALEPSATSSTSLSGQKEVAAISTDPAAGGVNIDAGSSQSSSPSSISGAAMDVSGGISTSSSSVSIGGFDASGAPVLSIGGISVVTTDVTGSSSTGSTSEIKPDTALESTSPGLFETTSVTSSSVSTAEQPGSVAPISTDPAASSSSGLADTIGTPMVDSVATGGAEISGPSVGPISGITFGSGASLSGIGSADLPSAAAVESSSTSPSSEPTTTGSIGSSVSLPSEPTSGSSFGSSVGISSGSFDLSGISIAASPSPSDMGQSSSDIPAGISTASVGLDAGISTLPVGSPSISGVGVGADPASEAEIGSPVIESSLPGLSLLPAGSFSISTTGDAPEHVTSESAGTKPSGVDPSVASASDISVSTPGINPESITTGTSLPSSTGSSSDANLGGIEAGGAEVTLTQTGVTIDAVGSPQIADSSSVSTGQAVGPDATNGIVQGVVGDAATAGGSVPTADPTTSVVGFVHSGISPQAGIDLPTGGATLVSGTLPVSQASPIGTAGTDLEDEASDENLSGDVQGFSTEGDVYFDYDYTWFTQPYTRSQVQPIPTRLTKGNNENGKSSEEIASAEAVLQNNNSGETEEQSVEITVADSQEKESTEISGEASNEAQSASVENVVVQEQISVPEIETQQGSGTVDAPTSVASSSADIQANVASNVQAQATEAVQSSVPIVQDTTLEAFISTYDVTPDVHVHDLIEPPLTDTQTVVNEPQEILLEVPASQDVLPENPWQITQPNADVAQAPIPEVVPETIINPVEPAIVESAIASSAIEIQNPYHSQVNEPNALSGPMLRTTPPLPNIDDPNADIENWLMHMIDLLMPSKKPTAASEGAGTAVNVASSTGAAAGTISITDTAPDANATPSETVVPEADVAAAAPEATTVNVPEAAGVAVPSAITSEVGVPAISEAATIEQILPSAPAAEPSSLSTITSVGEPTSSNRPAVFNEADEAESPENTQEEVENIDSTEGDDQVNSQQSGSQEDQTNDQQSGEDDEIQDDGSNEGSVQAEDDESDEVAQDDEEQTDNDSDQQQDEQEDQSAQQNNNDDEDEDDSEDDSRERKLRKKQKKEIKKEEKKVVKHQARIQKILEEQDRIIEEKLKREAEEKKRQEEKQKLQLEMQMKREDLQVVTNKEMEVNEMKIREQAEKAKLKELELQQRLQFQSKINKNLLRALKQRQEDFEIARAYINNREKLVKLAKKVYQNFGMNANEQTFQCNDAGYFPDPENCRKYFICYSKSGSAPALKLVHLECPSHQLFDTVSSICGHYKEAVCADEKYFKVFNGRQ